MSPVFPFLICFMFTSSRVSRVAAVHHPLLESLRTLIPTYSTTVVLDVGILGLVISQRSLTSRLKKNT